MLLAIDVGNTNTVIGVYDDKLLSHNWRVRTLKDITTDEFNLLIRNLLFYDKVKINQISRTIISCVVPAMVPIFKSFCTSHLGHNPHFVNFKSYNKMPFLIKNPSELGADRIANSVASYNKYLQNLIVIDFGTATTFDCISKRGEFLGGAISPGIGIMSDVLFKNTSIYHESIMKAPEYAIGKNTFESTQSGIIFGYAGLVDGVVKRIKKEMTNNTLVISTGGLAPMMWGISKTIQKIEPLLTLEGLRIIDTVV